MDIILSTITNELGVKYNQVESAVKLIDEGNTIPFIARYRKEATGGLSDEQLRQLGERLTYLRNLDARKQEVLTSIENQGKLTDEIVANLAKAITLAEVEDIYRPYKQKKRTRATIAKEKGLEPLAEMIIAQNEKEDINSFAQNFINEEKEVNTIEDAIAGAKDIIAENISDDPEYRKYIKKECNINGLVVSKCAKKEITERTAYEMYYVFFDLYF